MAQAQTIEPTNFDEINFQITSKENPDAYIESRFVPGNSAYARSSEEDGKTLVGYVDATVYVEETYTKGEDGNIFTTDSRLLSEEEVMSIGKSEFDVPVQSVQPRISTIGDKTTSRGKLTIRFTVMAYSQARRYQLNLTSNWSGLSWLSTGDTNSPGWGDDIMGFAWGGGYDFDGYGYGTHYPTQRNRVPHPCGYSFGWRLPKGQASRSREKRKADTERNSLSTEWKRERSSRPTALPADLRGSSRCSSSRL